MRFAQLVEVVLVFAPLSFLTVGGGQSIVADIHRQSVDVYGWVTNPQFMDLYALSRIIPGPGALLVYALAHLWTRFKGTRCIRAIEAGLVPVAAGMVLAASCTVLRAAEGGAWAWGVAAASTLTLMYTRLSPFLMLGIGALVFLVALG